MPPATEPRASSGVAGGRDQVVATIAARLTRHRLVTIAGPGGIGKTTVALAVAERLIAD
jgi:predicted ATPase